MQDISQRIREDNLTYMCGMASVSVALLWPVLTNWLLHIDFAGRIPTLMLAFSSLIMLGEVFRKSFRKPLSIYCLLAVYMVLNGVVMDSMQVYEMDGLWRIVTGVMNPVAAMLIVSTLAQRKWDKTISILILICELYCLMALFNSSIDTRDEYNRLNSELNANEMALVAASLFGMILLKRPDGKWSLGRLLLFVLPVMLIFETGSRMAFGMIAIMTAGYLLDSGDIRKPRRKVFVFVIMALLLVLLFFILNNTMIGERLLMVFNQGEESDHELTNTILDFYGDRGFQYYYSWPYFLANPVFGIGLYQWILYSPSDLVSHSEYMVQYLECGLVAFIPYVCFLYMLIRDLRMSRKVLRGSSRSITGILLAMMFAVLFANTVTWSYNEIAVFFVYALCFVYPRISKPIVENESGRDCR